MDGGTNTVALGMERKTMLIQAIVADNFEQIWEEYGN